MLTMLNNVNKQNRLKEKGAIPKMKKIKFTAVIMIILLLLLTFTGCININVPAETPNEPTVETSEEASEILAQHDKFVGSPTPDFKMKNLDGELTDVKDLKGTPYLLVFSRTDCPACIEMQPLLENLKTEVKIVEVFRRDSEKTLLQYSQDLSIALDRTWLAGEDDTSNNTIIEAFELVIVPTIFYVDKSGIVKEISTGTLSVEELSVIVDSIL